MTESGTSVLLVVKGLDIGGIERIVVDVATGLRRRGVDVDVAVVNDRRDRLIPQLEQSGISVLRLGGHDRVGLVPALRLARLLRRGGHDVVHVHGPLPAVFVRVLAGRTPVVTTSHTLWGSLRPVTRLLWRATSFRDAVCLAVSSAVVESLPKRVARRTAVMPHGIDIEAVERARGHGGVRKSDGHVDAICVASHRDAKNYPNLLHAVAEARASAPSLRLIAVGDGPDESRHRRLAHDLGLDDIVRFEPARLDVLDVMATADLLVVASDFEGQPLVVMEAMALGLPVVATAVGRVPELVGPSEGRMVPPGDSAALAAALIEMEGNPELRRTLGDRARAVSRSWSLDDVVTAHVAVYDGIVAETRSSSKGPTGRRWRRSRR